MKIALWIVFTLITALWTGTVLISAELTGWLASTVGSGQAGDVITSVGQWPVPAWLGLLIDPAWIEGLQTVWGDVMGWLGQSGPTLGSVVSWLVPLMWIVWGVVMLLLLAAAVACHFLLSKFSRPSGLTRRAA
ncbi:MAG: hypothetical protein ACI83N_001370 [Hydrogenophaga sp.]|jgi:hypothetical protein